MHPPYLFLDIDGVLNAHERQTNGWTSIDYRKVEALNMLLENTGAKIVLTSAWRYFLHRGEMNLHGLNGLLATHGLTWPSVIGVLEPEGLVADRGSLVLTWLRRNWGGLPRGSLKGIAAVDDLDLGYSAAGVPFVQTCGTVGLTVEHCQRLAELLRRPCD